LLKLTYEHLAIQKIFRGFAPWTTRDGREERKEGRVGREREKGRERGKKGGQGWVWAPQYLFQVYACDD
jgi:hypothetical protein